MEIQKKRDVQSGPFHPETETSFTNQKNIYRAFPYRNLDRLTEIIQRKVEVGTRIITECRRGYSLLDSIDIEHLPQNSLMHFQNVENLWKSDKTLLKKK